MESLWWGEIEEGFHRANFARWCRGSHLHDPARQSAARRKRPGHYGSEWRGVV